ncbi:hypothetical protein [Streptomyces sp. NPDC059994]|uniref:hypothetical protein n=1 Tax=Streptomyces sp. NPDC059994 TaxID=3347029 RepID=UPI0036BDED73
MRINDLSLRGRNLVRLLVMAISVLGLGAVSISTSTAAVHTQACGAPYPMPGERKVQVDRSHAAWVYLVYDPCKYSTYAVISASGLGGTSAWWLAVDLVDQNGVAYYHGDTRGYGHEDHAQTLDLTLDHTGGAKKYQVRAWFRNQSGCSVFFDSDWHAYSDGSNQGGGWDTSC